jgi:hypothetical protein
MESWVKYTLTIIDPLSPKVDDLAGIHFFLFSAGEMKWVLFCSKIWGDLAQTYCKCRWEEL